MSEITDTEIVDWIAKRMEEDSVNDENLAVTLVMARTDDLRSAIRTAISLARRVSSAKPTRTVRYFGKDYEVPPEAVAIVTNLDGQVGAFHTTPKNSDDSPAWYEEGHPRDMSGIPFATRLGTVPAPCIYWRESLMMIPREEEKGAGIEKCEAERSALHKEVFAGLIAYGGKEYHQRMADIARREVEERRRCTEGPSEAPAPFVTEWNCFYGSANGAADGDLITAKTEFVLGRDGEPVAVSWSHAGPQMGLPKPSNPYPNIPTVTAHETPFGWVAEYYGALVKIEKEDRWLTAQGEEKGESQLLERWPHEAPPNWISREGRWRNEYDRFSQAQSVVLRMQCRPLSSLRRIVFMRDGKEVAL